MAWQVQETQRLGSQELARAGRVDPGLLDKLTSQLQDNNLVADKYSVAITLKHIKCLKPLTWLNSEVITFWLEWWREQIACNSQSLLSSQPKCFFTNSYFYSKLAREGKEDKDLDDNYCYSNVKKWTCSVNVFGLDKMIVPINHHNQHWFLAVIDFKNKRTVVYDSIGVQRETVHRNLHCWLADEHFDKLGTHIIPEEWTRCHQACPLQENGSDCGVYMCLFAERVSINAVNAPDLFSQSQIDLARCHMIQVIYKAGETAGHVKAGLCAV